MVLDSEVSAPPSAAGLTEDCVRRLRKVCGWILEEPRAVRMSDWILRSKDLLLGERSLSFPECGVVGCIAGWVVLQDGRMPADGDFELYHVGNAAARILGLDQDQARRLFSLGAWPWSFLERLRPHRPHSLGYARAVADRIEHFILTGGAE